MQAYLFHNRLQRPFCGDEALRKLAVQSTMVFLAASFFLGSCMLSRAESSPLTVSVTPWQGEMRLGGPIAIDLTARNLSDSPITMDLGEDEKEGVNILLRSADGKIYSSSWAPKEGMALVGKVKINPNSETERILVLQDWNIYPVPGKYEAVISFKHSARADDGRELTLPSQSVPIIVVETSDRDIASSCELARSYYLRARDYTEASIAANLLKNFTVPSALSCLSEVYQSGSPYHLEYIFIRAIAKIGTDPAKSILAQIEKSDNKEDADIAGRMLNSVTIPSRPR